MYKANNEFAQQYCSMLLTMSSRDQDGKIVCCEKEQAINSSGEYSEVAKESGMRSKTLQTIVQQPIINNLEQYVVMLMCTHVPHNFVFPATNIAKHSFYCYFSSTFEVSICTLNVGIIWFTPMIFLFLRN